MSGLPTAGNLEMDFGIGVVVDPAQANVLYAATPDGVYKSEDAGAQ